MSQSLVMEAEATPWGPGEGEAALPLEKQGRKSSRSPGRGMQMSKSAVRAVGAGDGTPLPGPGWGRAGRRVSWRLCALSQSAPICCHTLVQSVLEAPLLLASLLMHGMGGRLQARPVPGLSPHPSPLPPPWAPQRSFSELAGSTGLTLGIPRRKALDADSHCWLLFIDPDQHGPLCATDAGHVCNVQFSSSHI